MTIEVDRPAVDRVDPPRVWRYADYQALLVHARFHDRAALEDVSFTVVVLDQLYSFLERILTVVEETSGSSIQIVCLRFLSPSGLAFDTPEIWSAVDTGSRLESHQIERVASPAGPRRASYPSADRAGLNRMKTVLASCLFA